MSTLRSPRAWAYRNEIGLLAALVLGALLLPGALSVGETARGLVDGAVITLSALGVVLVYRANRFVNFAQFPLATAAGGVFAGLVKGQVFLNLSRSLCGCVSRDPQGISVTLNFLLAALVSVALAAGLSFAFYAVLLRRFTRSPRLVLTIFTVFAAQSLLGFFPTLRGWFIGQGEEALARALDRPIEPPLDFAWKIGPATELRLADLILLASAAVAVFWVRRFLQGSDAGVAIRAASESPARAQSLGVDVVAVTGRVWFIAGLLAGVVGVVSAFNLPAGTVGMPGPGDRLLSIEALVVVLVVALCSRFLSFEMVLASGLVVGLVRAAVQGAFGSTVLVDAALVVLVGCLLLMQQNDRGRADRHDAADYEVAREVRPVAKELAHLPQVKAWVRYGMGASLVTVLGLPWLLARADVAVLTTFVIFTLVGLSLVVLTGWTGQVSFGQFGFAAIGAWAAAVSGLPMPLAVLVGATVGACAAVVVGYPAMRLSGLTMAVSTMAFAVSVAAVFTSDRYLGRMLPDSLTPPKLLGMDVAEPRVFYYTMVVLVAAAAAGVASLRRSRLGRALIAARANEPAALAFGISVLRLRLTAAAVSGFLAALAGGLFAFQQGAVRPESFAAERSLELFLFSVIGGLGGVSGPFFGFAFMAALSLFSDNPLLRYVGAGTGAMFLLFAAPGGLSQVFYDSRDAALRRLATRLRIPVPSLHGDRAGAFDRAQLDEVRSRRTATARTLRYKLANQWALGRYGSADERAVQPAGNGRGA